MKSHTQSSNCSSEPPLSVHPGISYLVFLSLFPVNLLFICSVVSNSLRPHRLQHTRLPVLHHLPEFVQTHVHWVGDAIQPSYLLLSSPPPAFNQHLLTIKMIIFLKSEKSKASWCVFVVTKYEITCTLASSLQSPGYIVLAHAKLSVTSKWREKNSHHKCPRA